MTGNGKNPNDPGGADPLKPPRQTDEGSEGEAENFANIEPEDGDTFANIEPDP